MLRLSPEGVCELLAMNLDLHPLFGGRILAEGPEEVNAQVLPLSFQHFLATAGECPTMV